ncbi:DHS-like NAD/FAD-binding domain-containing protein [Leptodontidium sp. 2 PMI_412]|nr:DHS-like NAD/FAD-binding domain-containing protein [Leptodontidium sp. 2 PMI_412]
MEDQGDYNKRLDTLTHLIKNKRRIVAIIGAGVSTAAGVPDFSSNTDRFNEIIKRHELKYSVKDLFDKAMLNTEKSVNAFKDVICDLHKAAESAQPTRFHHLLATLAEQKQLLRLYTQNIDDLDTRLAPLTTETPLEGKNNNWPQTIQLHGSVSKMICPTCHEHVGFKPKLFSSTIRRSDRLAGNFRPTITLYQDSFEEATDGQKIQQVINADLKRKPDLLIVAGTSLKIKAVKKMVELFGAAVHDDPSGSTVWINMKDEPQSNQFPWDLKINSNCEKLAEDIGLPCWDETVSCPCQISWARLIL